MRYSVVFFLASFGALLVGCGGGGANPSSGELGSVSPNTTVATGIAQLNAALKSSYVNKTASVALYSPANTSFKGAFTANPADPKAAAGYAITTVMVRSLDVYHVLAGSDPVLNSSAPPHGIRAALLAPHMFTSGSYKFTDAGFATVQDITGVRPATSTTDLRQLILTDVAKVQAQIVPLKALLSGPLSDTLINGLEASPLILVDPSTNKSVSIGKAEMLAFRGGLRGIIASLQILTAYSYDIGTFDINKNPNVVLASKIASGTPFSSSLLLPSSPFLTRTTNPGAEPATLILAGANDAIACVNAFKSRAGTKFLLNPTAVPPLSQAKITSDANSVKSYMTAPQTISGVYNGNAVTLTVNVGYFINHLPPDLKALLPNIKSVPDSNIAGSHGIYITTFPDLKFGGLVTNGNTALTGLQNQAILSNGMPVDFEQAQSFGQLYKLLYNISVGNGSNTYPWQKTLRIITDWSPGNYSDIAVSIEGPSFYNYGSIFKGNEATTSTDFDITGSGTAKLHADLWVKSTTGSYTKVGSIDKFILLGTGQTLKLGAGYTYPPTSLAVSPGSANLAIGKTQQFIAYGIGAGGRITFAPPNYFVWSTTGGIATVSSGLVKGVKAGTGTVELKYKNPVLTRSLPLTVH